MDLIRLDGITPSANIREQLATEGRPILLSFSRGKDSIAAWLALRDSGVHVIPYYFYGVPGLEFAERSLAYFEEFFGQRIARYPHPSLYRKLNNFVLQPPERLAIIEAARLPTPTYADMARLVREEHGLEPDSWDANGVRAADSIVRRISIKNHGPMKPTSHKVSVVWDWRKPHVMDRISHAGIDLPVDYEWFGRSFDGIDERFLRPLSIHAPDDYRRVLDWFPLADLELIRGGL